MQACQYASVCVHVYIFLYAYVILFYTAMCACVNACTYVCVFVFVCPHVFVDRICATCVHVHAMSVTLPLACVLSTCVHIPWHVFVGPLICQSSHSNCVTSERTRLPFLAARSLPEQIINNAEISICRPPTIPEQAFPTLSSIAGSRFGVKFK